jgi:hypothetical protein
MWASSTGVGTATMMKSAFASVLGSVLTDKRVAAQGALRKRL